MKKILIPTDFSTNAKKATDYALTLFNETGVEVTLLNTFYIPYSAPDVAYSLNDVTYDNAKMLFEKEHKRIKDKFPSMKFSIDDKFSIGDVVNVVCSLENKEDYDLIVMGTKGASGMTEYLVGSRTASMVKSAKTPLLVVPEDADLTAPKRILFTADEELIDRKINFDVLKKIANSNESKIDALHITDTDENHDVIAAFIDYELDLNFVDIPHELRLERGKDVEKAIEKYTEKYPIDLVVMVSTRGGLFYNLFHKSVSKAVAMHTKIPLLIFHTNLKND